MFEFNENIVTLVRQLNVKRDGSVGIGRVFGVDMTGVVVEEGKTCGMEKAS